MFSKILVNPEVLSQSHVPEKLGLVNTFVQGSIGSGKTLLLKHTIEHYYTTKKGRAIYIDRSLYQTTNAIFHEILTALAV